METANSMKNKKTKTNYRKIWMNMNINIMKTNSINSIKTTKMMKNNYHISDKL